MEASLTKHDVKISVGAPTYIPRTASPPSSNVSSNSDPESSSSSADPSSPPVPRRVYVPKAKGGSGRIVMSGDGGFNTLRPSAAERLDGKAASARQQVLKELRETERLQRQLMKHKVKLSLHPNPSETEQETKARQAQEAAANQWVRENLIGT